ncbi:hypothetical protein [Streptomyces cyanogenus]|uniref:Uncharacterized protein n=1 Tax=Streptomyces cyanogenus TaxID=80860 RepID=A0ABX7TZI0_STRCY|nr:hypothetical protein [Streptomyces cyanogenus]QTE01902.1 hypothetical protein S1361_31515 [Streptomyces cyanogenus]
MNGGPPCGTWCSPRPARGPHRLVNRDALDLGECVAGLRALGYPLRDLAPDAWRELDDGGHRRLLPERASSVCVVSRAGYTGELFGQYVEFFVQENHFPAPPQSG